MVIPEELKIEYPFNTKSFEIKPEIKMNYIDEGIGPVIVMVHGNPTWSFYYRNLVKLLSNRYRVIVPDHIGTGLSTKPQDYDYKLENHIDNLNGLLKHLNVDEYSLVVHDWGGAIGIGNAIKKPEKLKSLIILNTAAFTSTFISKRIDFCRIPILGEWMIRSFNAFALPATFMAVTKKMNPIIKKGFLLPYDNYKNRIATAKFVTDIPMNKEHTSYKTLFNIEQNLHNLKCPKLVLWGMKDFCFNDTFLNRWEEIFPESEFVKFEDGGHYILEDEKDETSTQVADFFDKNIGLIQ